MDDEWTIITSKYYLDGEADPVAKEIDIIAYKTAVINGILKYTALIISCKKKANDAYAFLVRRRNDKDPNFNWNPTSIWTNATQLKFAEGKFGEEFVKYLKEF